MPHLNHQVRIGVKLLIAGVAAMVLYLLLVVSSDRRCRRLDSAVGLVGVGLGGGGQGFGGPDGRPGAGLTARLARMALRRDMRSSRTPFVAALLAFVALPETAMGGEGDRYRSIVRGVGDVFSDCAECPEMVVIPSGRFRMGCLSTHRNCPDFPASGARGDDPAAIRVGQVRGDVRAVGRVCGGGGCGGYSPEPEDGRRGDYPVTHVTWEDAQSYVSWLSAATGLRVPPAERVGVGVRGTCGDRDRVLVG